MTNQELARKLNYTLYSDEERAHHVQALLDNEGLNEYFTKQFERGVVTDNSPVAQQLETLANFILYGKREGGKNAIELKEVSQPPTRYATFTRKTHLSLDELAESPQFDEQETRPVERNSYLTPKRKIVRPVYAQRADTGELICLNENENDSHIAGMHELWQSIDYLEWLAGKSTWTPEPLSNKTYQVPGATYRVYRVNHPVYTKEDGSLAIDSTPPPTPPKLTSLAAYRVKHWLIDRKKHQYYLKESANPTAFAQHFSFTPPTPVDWEEDSGYWLTRTEAQRLNRNINLECWRWRPVTVFDYEKEANLLLTHTAPEASPLSQTPESELGYYNGSEKLRQETYSQHLKLGYAPARDRAHQFVREYFSLVAEHTLDFTNPDHVYALLENYRDLRVATYDKLNSQMRHILDQFQEIVNRTELHESRDIILYYKIHKYTNQRIARELEEFGYSYAVNYISTIYKQEICKKVARQAQVMEEEWRARDNINAWRKCSICGANKLANGDNYTSKPKNYGGLSYRCKACDREARQRRNNKNE